MSGTDDLRGDGIHHVGRALERLSGELGLSAARGAIVVQERWDAVVGEALAARTRPVRLRHGVLTVEVDDPALASRVRYLGGRITDALNAEAGEGTVREVVVTVRRQAGGGSGSGSGGGSGGGSGAP